MISYVWLLPREALCVLCDWCAPLRALCSPRSIPFPLPPTLSPSLVGSPRPGQNRTGVKGRHRAAGEQHQGEMGLWGPRESTLDLAEKGGEHGGEVDMQHLWEGLTQMGRFIPITPDPQSCADAGGGGGTDSPSVTREVTSILETWLVRANKEGVSKVWG